MSKKRVETEIRLKVRNADEVKSRLKAVGARLVSKKQYTDYQFTLTSRNFWDSVEALRVRVVDWKEGGVLTYKPSGKKTERYMQVREYETYVENPDVLMQMFGFLGVKPLQYVPKIRKTRYSYKLDDFNIELDRYPKVGYFMDIELLSSKKGKDEIRRINELARKLGFTENDIQNTAVGFLLKDLAISRGAKNAK